MFNQEQQEMKVVIIKDVRGGKKTELPEYYIDVDAGYLRKFEFVVEYLPYKKAREKYFENRDWHRQCIDMIVERKSQ